MQIDAFPDPRPPRELQLVEQGKFALLVQIFTDYAVFIRFQPKMTEAEKDKRAADSLKSAARYRGEIAAIEMDRALPW